MQMVKLQWWAKGTPILQKEGESCRRNVNLAERTRI